MCCLWFFSLVQNTAQTECYSFQPAVGKFTESSSSSIWSYICWSQLQFFHSILQWKKRPSESKHNLNQIRVEQASLRPKFQSSACFAAKNGKVFSYLIRLSYSSFNTHKIWYELWYICILSSTGHSPCYLYFITGDEQLPSNTLWWQKEFST